MNSGETDWSYLETGVACHHGCVLEEMRRLAEEIDRLRVELGATKLVLESQDLRLEAWHEEIERLEELILTGDYNELEAEGARILQKRESR